MAMTLDPYISGSFNPLKDPNKENILTEEDYQALREEIDQLEKAAKSADSELKPNASVARLNVLQKKLLKRYVDTSLRQKVLTLIAHIIAAIKQEEKQNQARLMALLEEMHWVYDYVPAPRPSEKLETGVAAAVNHGFIVDPEHVFHVAFELAVDLAVDPQGAASAVEKIKGKFHAVLEKFKAAGSYVLDVKDRFLAARRTTLALHPQEDSIKHEVAKTFTECFKEKLIKGRPVSLASLYGPGNYQAASFHDLDSQLLSKSPKPRFSFGGKKKKDDDPWEAPKPKPMKD